MHLRNLLQAITIVSRSLMSLSALLDGTIVRRIDSPLSYVGDYCTRQGKPGGLGLGIQLRVEQSRNC